MLMVVRSHRLMMLAMVRTLASDSSDAAMWDLCELRVI
jgi:hypothetical protein